jgi:hypothetical protein
MIAALYVQTGGEYFGRPDVDPWDEPRDARLYRGPYPVVAHPPCQLWVNLAAVNWKRYGRQRPAWYPEGSDGGCFAAALEAVFHYGGVLEHPAFTHAWAEHGLPAPQGIGWTQVPGAPVWVCEVWQSAYGHLARKRTWLVYHGSQPPLELRWNRDAWLSTHQVGWFDRNKKTLSKREANATPSAFAEALIELARHSRGVSR